MKDFKPYKSITHCCC